MHIQIASEYLQGGRIHNISGQPVSVLTHSASEKVFPDVEREFLVFWFVFVPIASGPVMEHH